MPKSRFLVCLDTDKIKDYVFATNKLKEIRGASAILDELNQDITFNILQKEFGNGNYSYDVESKIWVQNNDTDHINWEVIFLGLERLSLKMNVMHKNFVKSYKKDTGKLQIAPLR